MTLRTSTFATHFVAILSLLILIGCISAETETPGPDAQAVNGAAVEKPSTPVPADVSVTSAPKIIFVFDASGSMWAKVGSEEKIVSAKRVLKNAVANLPDDAHVGLIAYGHRSKSDCVDIETIVPLGPIDKAGISSSIDALDPKGKTPITDSLRKAIAEVKAMNLDETVKIVLISDGLETCAGDPCKLVKEAREAGVKITAHVIGFDTGKLTVDQLECIAQAGGGSYLSAEDADQLGTALETVTAAVPAYNNFISIKTVVDGKLHDSFVKVRDSKTGKDVEAARTYESAETNPRRIPVPVGTYDVSVRSIKIDGSPTISFEKIEVKADETAERTADFSAGELKVKVTLNGKFHDSSVTAYSESTKTAVAQGRTYTAEKTLKVVPGRYYVEIQPLAVEGLGAFTIRNVIVSGGGKQTFIEHNFDAGTLRIGTRQGGQLIDSTVAVADAATGQSVAAGRTYTTASSNPRQFIIKPGTYKVTVQPLKPKGLAAKEITVTVKTGETTEENIEY